MSKKRGLNPAAADRFRKNIEKPQEGSSLAADDENTNPAEKLAKRLQYDGLTGLFNRWTINEIMAEKLARGIPFAALFIDVDKFKQVNDLKGHQVGDELLKQIADLLSAVVHKEEEELHDNLTIAKGRGPREDAGSRWGGDEFVIAVDLSNEDPENYESVIREIVSDIRAIKIAEYDITLSVGSALSTQYGELSEVLDAADQAMYTDKDSRTEAA